MNALGFRLKNDMVGFFFHFKGAGSFEKLENFEKVEGGDWVASNR